MTASGSVSSQAQVFSVNVKAMVDEFVQLLAGDFDHESTVPLVHRIMNCLTKLLEYIDHNKQKQLCTGGLKKNIDKSIELLNYLDQVPKAKILKSTYHFDDLRNIIHTSIQTVLSVYHAKFMASLAHYKNYKKNPDSEQETEKYDQHMETIYTHYVCNLADVRDYYMRQLRIKMDTKQYYLCKQCNDLILELTSDVNILENYIDNDDLDEEVMEKISKVIKDELQQLSQLNIAMFIGDAISHLEKKQQQVPSSIDALSMLKNAILNTKESEKKLTSPPPPKKTKFTEPQQATIEVKASTEAKEESQVSFVFEDEAIIDPAQELLLSRQVMEELDAAIKEFSATDDNVIKWLNAAWYVFDHNCGKTGFDEYALELQSIINTLSQYILRNDTNKAADYMDLSKKYYEYIIYFVSLMAEHFHQHGHYSLSYLTCKSALGYVNIASSRHPEDFKQWQITALNNVYQLYEECKQYLIEERIKTFDLGKESGDFTNCSLMVKHIDNFVQLEGPSIERSAADEQFLQENRKVLTDIAIYTQEELLKLRIKLKTILSGVIKIPVKDVSAPGFDDLPYKQKLDQAIDEMLNGLDLSLPLYRQLVMTEFHSLPKKGLPSINLPEQLKHISPRLIGLYEDARVIVDAAKAFKSDKAREHKEICDKRIADAENSHSLFLKLVVEPEDTLLAPGYKSDRFVEELKLLSVNTIATMVIPFKEVGSLIQRLPKLSGMREEGIKLDAGLSVFTDFYLKANVILAKAKAEKKHYQRLEKERVDAIKLQKFKRTLVNTLTFKVVLPEEDSVNAPEYNAKKYKKEVDALVEAEINKITIMPENQLIFMWQLPTVNGVKNGEEKLTADYLLIDFYRQARVIVDSAEHDKKQSIKKLLQHKELMREKALKQQRLKDITEMAAAIAKAVNLALIDTKVTIDFQINTVDESVEFIFVPCHGSPAFIYHNSRVMKKDFFENVIVHQLKEYQLTFAENRNGQTLIVKGVQKNQLILKKINRITSRAANFLQEKVDKSHELQQKLEAEAVYEKLLSRVLGEDVPLIVSQAKDEIPADDLFEFLFTTIANEEVKQSITEAKANEQAELLISDVIADEIHGLWRLCDEHNMAAEIDELLNEACRTDDAFPYCILPPVTIVDDEFINEFVSDKKVDSEFKLDVGSIMSAIESVNNVKPVVSMDKFPTVFTATIRAMPFSFFKDKAVCGAMVQVDEAKRALSTPSPQPLSHC